MTIGKFTSNKMQLDETDNSTNDMLVEIEETIPIFDVNRKSNLVKLLQQAKESMPPPPTRSKSTFENTIEAANKNIELIAKLNFRLEEVFASEPTSTIHPKFEFRDEKLVSKLFDLSTDGEALKQICFKGVDYPIREDADTSDETRIQDAEYWLEKGNNKSANGEEEVVFSAVAKEISKGWGIVIPKSQCLSVEGIGIVPITVASKFTKVDDDDNILSKKRLAHDCTNPGISGQSVNNMVDDDNLEECRFGNVLIQTLYEIHQMRFQYGPVPILLSKYDLDAAYRRLSVLLRHALRCGIAFEDLVYLCFRLPFGSKPAPALFSLLSEFVAELSQCLSEDETWEPSELFSSMLDDIDTSPIYSSGEFGRADPLLVDYTAKKLSIRVFIDDLISVVLANESLILRAIHAVPLVLDSVFRPNFDNELVKRNPILSQEKLLAEGILSEVQVILGWLINTRKLKLFITSQKSRRILIGLKNLIKYAEKQLPVNRKGLESMIGQLQDIAFIIPEGKFFLNRLRYRLKVLKWRNNCRFFDKMEKMDLVLWMSIVNSITEGNVGRSFNSILKTHASILCISDACEHGVGGLIIVNGVGFAWRFIIPEKWMHYFSINFLEFFGSGQGIKYVCEHITGQRILSISDSTNALAWLDTNKFDPHKQPHHDELARHFMI